MNFSPTSNSVEEVNGNLHGAEAQLFLHHMKPGGHVLQGLKPADAPEH